MSTGPFRVRPGTVRMPSVGYARRDRFKDGIPDIMDGGPDLAVELPADGNTPAEFARKYEEYLSAGTRLIWEIDRTERLATVIRPDGRRSILTIGDVFDGEDVLPGFQYPLEDYFNDPQVTLRFPN
jgi:Uma2 family endonuclease